MADNVTTDLGVFATDTIDSVMYQRMKLSWGVDGAAVDASASNPLPVVQTGTHNIGTVTTVTTLSTITNPVTVNAGTNLNTSLLALEAGGNLATIAGKDFATQTTLSTLNGKVTVCDTGAVVISSGTITTVTGITNVVHVDDNGSTLTVDGTVAATQSGTWNVTNISGTVSLPTGASTESTLSTLNGKVTACNTGAVVVSSGSLNVGTVTTLPARAATADSITAKIATDTIQNGTTALTPKFANVSAASNGDNAIIALVSNKKLRVLAISLIGSGTAVSLYLSSSNSSGTKLLADGTNKILLDKTGATGPSGFVLGFNPVGWFETASGEALNMNLSAAQAVVGTVTYVEV